MTTTGGPDQFLADPARTGERSDDPVVLDRARGHFDGDDITVEPRGPETPNRRARGLLAAGIVLVLAAGGIGTAIALRNHGGTDTGASKLSSTQGVRPPSAHPIPRGGAVVTKPKPRLHPKPVTPVTPAKPVKPVKLTQQGANVVTPQKVASTPVQTPPPATPAGSRPVATVPLSAPPSVLEWTSTPRAITIKAGAHVVFTVSVFNPTKRNVTLPQPLSCPPTARGAQGTIGGAVCAQETQVMAPHQHLTQKYTIYATTTADASGKPLLPGLYVASVENLFDVKVTVTK